MSTRPRIIFNEDGICNACSWVEEKKSLDWQKRQNEFKELIRRKGPYDCIVPVSGGKDGSYVSHKLTKDYNLKVLTVTIRPPLEYHVGRNNLVNFVNSGYEHMHVSPCFETMRQLNKIGFLDHGRPLYGWTTSIFTSVFRVAKAFQIPLIVYGEDGEVEYGGTRETEQKSLMNIGYIKRVYLEGEFERTKREVINSNDDKRRLNWYCWEFPEEDSNEIQMIHWSYFENWDSYRNYLVAKEHCGLQENDQSNVGTYTNFSQNDTVLYPLHTYLMYLKFGFGRATQDVGIDIRRGALSREQGVALATLYDNQPPDQQMVKEYLDYFDITQSQYDEAIDRHTNKMLFEKRNGTWSPIFQIK